VRLLIVHVDSFACTITEKGRSPVIEAPSTATTRIHDGLLVLTSVEKGDESDAAGVVARTAEEIASLAGQLKVEQVMLLPFAHLFAQLAPPGEALALIDSGSRGIAGSEPHGRASAIRLVPHVGHAGEGPSTLARSADGEAGLVCQFLLPRAWPFSSGRGGACPLPPRARVESCAAGDTPPPYRNDATGAMAISIRSDH